MSRVCEITGKGTMSGNNVSHSNRHTRRKFYPNLHNVTIYSPKAQKSISLRVSSHGLRTIQKYNDIFDFIALNQYRIVSKKLLDFIK